MERNTIRVEVKVIVEGECHREGFYGENRDDVMEYRICDAWPMEDVTNKQRILDALKTVRKAVKRDFSDE